jgi:hypothetical protein
MDTCIADSSCKDYSRRLCQRILRKVAENILRGTAMQRRFICLIAAVFSTTAIALANDEYRLQLGMTPREVEKTIGPPDVVRLERNGVRCFGYQPHPQRLPNVLLVRETLLIAFRANRLVEHIDVYPYDIDLQCSQIASEWDLPPSNPITCFRKFWLGCP